MNKSTQSVTTIKVAEIQVPPRGSQHFSIKESTFSRESKHIFVMVVKSAI